MIALLIVALAAGPQLVPPAAPRAREPARGYLLAVGGGGTTEDIRKAALAVLGKKAPVVIVLPQASARPNAGQGSVEMWRESGVEDVSLVRLDDGAPRGGSRRGDPQWRDAGG